MFLTIVAIPYVLAAVAAAVLIARGIRGGRPMRVGFVIVAVPVHILFPAGWAGEHMPAGTNYWGDANPLAVLLAWPVLTTLLYLAIWLWSPEVLVGRVSKTHDNIPP